MDEIETLMERAAGLELSGTAARKAGQEAAAAGFFQSALELAVAAVNRSAACGSLPIRLNVLRATARLSLDCGQAVEARQLIDEASDLEGFSQQDEDWAELKDVSAWPDGWLIAAVRRDPPDAAALDALVERHEDVVGRGLLLTANHEKANARQMGFATVAVGRGKDKEPLARKLGAHHDIDSESGDAAAELQKLGGARVILATAPNAKEISSLVDGLSVDGKLLVPADP